jgi:NitT/TauT family transport system substrate-binding protein
MKQFNRRQFITSLSGLVLTQILPSCTWLDSKPITIAAHNWPGYESLFFANRETWLDRNQVNLVETTSASESMQRLSEGKVSGAALTLDEVLKARAHGLPLTIVMIFDISAGADMLISRARFKKITEIKGKRVGFEKGAVGELLLNEILNLAELKKTDIKPIELTIDKHLQAWQNNQIDAVVTYEPVASQLQSLGGFKLFDSREIPNTIVDVLAIRSDVLNFSHANAIRHLVAAHFHALNYINKNPQDAAYRMATHLGLPVVDVLPAFKGLVLPDANYNHRLMAGTSAELLLSAKRLVKSMLKNGLLKKSDSLNTLINTDYLPRDIS